MRAGRRRRAGDTRGIGGAGGTPADAAVVFEELGRALVPSPLLGTTLAELALLAADRARRRGAGVAGRGRCDRRTGVRPRLRGQRRHRRHRRRHQRRQTRPVDAFSAEPVTTMDPTRRLARLTAGSTAPLGTDPGIADAAAILLAAEQIGAAARCLDLTVEYTKERVQFGRPIGSFQALKHRMADLYVAVQAARAVVNDAVDAPSATSAALARVAATEAFSTVAAEGIQLHGGIAITWEHDMHLYFKRAHGSSHARSAARTLRRTGIRGASNVGRMSDRVALRAGIPPFYVMDVWLAAADVSAPTAIW